MAKRIVLITVKMEIDNPNLETITDEDVENVVENVDYNFNDVGDFHIKTYIKEYECQLTCFNIKSLVGKKIFPTFAG